MHLLKRLLIFLLGTVAIFSLSAEELLRNGFTDPQALREWENPEGIGKIVRLEDGMYALEITVPHDKANRSNTLTLDLHPEKLAGRRIRLSADLMYETEPPLTRWQGGKLMLAAKTSKGWIYTSSYFPHGRREWHTVVRTADLPPDLESIRLVLGLQSAAGTIRYRNLKLEVGDAILDLSSAANMGFADPAAGDGKGGWTDQGPEKDASGFRYRNRTFADIPFGIIPPGKNKGKSVLVFRSPYFKNGLDSAILNLETTVTKGRWLYLLHTLGYGKGNKLFGVIKVTGKNGKNQILNLRSGRDAGNWMNPKELKNGYPAAYWTTSGLGVCGVYASRFRLNDSLGELKTIEFRHSMEGPIWLLLAATISEQEYPFPEKREFVTKAGREWKALPIRRQGILEGSPLDRSFLNPPHKAGEFGRVVVGKSGHLEFEKRPGKAVRFFCSADGLDTFLGRRPVPSEIKTKQEIRDYVRQLHLHGYNMVRFHGVDLPLTRNQKEGTFNPDFLDRLDYLIFQLKENGIYINLDAMKSKIGYTPGNPYDASDKRDFKFDIYFSPAVRANWYNGLKQLLTHRNPYTGTTLAEDPVLAVIVGYNEQEFAFLRERDFSPALPAWRAFLKKKYNTISSLNSAWKNKNQELTSFDRIPIFKLSDCHTASGLGNDIAEFISGQETELFHWYKKTLSDFGYKGLVSNFNMGKSLRNTLVRKHIDLVTMNSYHAHPSNYNQARSTIDQASSIENAGNHIRGFIATRILGKPYLITEHGHAFWNRYRYEQAFQTGAYSAFQDFDGLTAFAQPVSVQTTSFINPFNIRFDPILRAEEFLTAFLFLRGDVTPARHRIRIPLSEQEILSGRAYDEGISGAQSRLGLLTGLAIDCGNGPALQPEEVILPRNGSSGIVVGNAFSSLADNGKGSFDPAVFVRELKKRGILPQDNRTQPDRELYETETGELLLDARRRFLSVNTERLQGICGEAGSKAKLKNLEVRSMSVRGNLALVSIDGKKSIPESERMVLVFATDARNSGMTFSDENARTLLKNGQAPILVRTGRFSIRIHGLKHSDFRAFALRSDGTRLGELPVEKEKNALRLSVDTASFPGDVPVYFELTRKQRAEK